MSREAILQLIKGLGASGQAYLPAQKITLDASFRDVCRSNGCGNYGLCYMCPPDVGEIGALMNRVRTYTSAALYQSIHPLEDSFDYEGMVKAGKQHVQLSLGLERALREQGLTNHLHLGAGGCKVCGVCAKREGKPCRSPEWAMPSLESYGVNVYETALKAQLRYINGQNTVTYFGMVLWNEG